MSRAVTLAAVMAIGALHQTRSVVGVTPSVEGQVEKLGKDLVCSACSFSMRSARSLLASKVKKSMKKSGKRRAAELALKAACEASRFPTQVAMMGEPGSRTYEDFQELMSKGGTLVNIQMTPENLENVQGVCKAIMDDLGPQIVDMCEQFKERVGGLNWERWACVRNLRLCAATQLDKREDDYDEDGPAAERDGDRDDL
eukprot:CAMPEP_0117555944 /NCGR_PEP_ID=MMETSP0784-20121206/51541_1 /TAXON_ID=39447 /ORGANISM="" /LENGTH=198 /DNA_ID=CAMNT_0005353177 /DNA_START=15 /DNA_END=611 /DNA_ORIENTATION=+